VGLPAFDLHRNTRRPVVEEAVAAVYRCCSVAEEIQGEADAWRHAKLVVLGCNAVASANLHGSIGDLILKGSAGAGREERDGASTVFHAGQMSVIVEAQSKGEREAAGHLPVVLHIGRDIAEVHLLVDVGGYQAGGRIHDRAALVERVIGCHIREIEEVEVGTDIAILKVIEIGEPIHIHAYAQRVLAPGEIQCVMRIPVILHPAGRPH